MLYFQEISSGTVEKTRQQYRTFVLNNEDTKLGEDSILYFKAGQDDLSDLTFALKVCKTV